MENVRWGEKWPEHTLLIGEGNGWHDRKKLNRYLVESLIFLFSLENDYLYWRNKMTKKN